MGFSSDPNIATDKSMVWTDIPAEYSSALAYNIFNELTQRYDDTGTPVANGGIKYFDVLYPATNYLTSKLLILETTQYSNHLASAAIPETWRIAFEVTGYTDTTGGGAGTFVGTALKAYVGTKTTIYPDATAANTWHYKENTVEVVLVEGGSTATSKRISESNLYSYRVSIAGDSDLANKKRGLVIACWETLKIEQDMKYFGFLCIQRPVGSTGQPNDAGTTPVICVHNTQSVNGIPKLSSNFYYSVIREKFIELPTKGFEITDQAHATAVLNFTYIKPPEVGIFSVPNPEIEIIDTNTGQNYFIRLGNNTPYGASNFNRMSGLYNTIGRSVFADYVNNPQVDANVLYNVLSNTIDIKFFKDEIKFFAPQSAEYYDPTTKMPVYTYQIRIIAQEAGEIGNNYKIKVTNASTGLRVTGGTADASGYIPFTGGGSDATRAYASIRFNRIPYVDPSGNTLNNDWIEINGVKFTFIDPSQTPAQRQVRIGTGTNAIQQTITNLINEILRYRHPDTLKADYSYSDTPKRTGVTGWETGDYLNIEFNEAGIHGNNFSVARNYSLITGSMVPSIDIQPAPDGISYNRLIGGTGWFDYGSTAVLSTEISDPLQHYGSMIYPFPKMWDAPVTTDHDEYVLEFPFGFCTDKLAFTEELDMIAVSKGMAYQARQDVPITVYGENRIYTALAINKQDYPSNPIRFFILTQGGNTKPIS